MYSDQPLGAALYFTLYLITISLERQTLNRAVDLNFSIFEIFELNFLLCFLKASVMIRVWNQSVSEEKDKKKKKKKILSRYVGDYTPYWYLSLLQEKTQSLQ